MIFFNNQYCEPEQESGKGLVRCGICSQLRPEDCILEYEFSDGEVIRICSIHDPAEFGDIINSYPVEWPDELDWEVPFEEDDY